MFAMVQRLGERGYRDDITYLMFWGGSIDGMNSRTAYAMPTTPMMVPNTLFIVCSSRRIDPTKM